jgi:hypothetical protein
MEEVNRRPALQLVMETLKRMGRRAFDHLPTHFDPNWPGVETLLDRVTPAYNRLVNAIWAVYDPKAIAFGGQIRPPWPK